MSLQKPFGGYKYVLNSMTYFYIQAFQKQIPSPKCRFGAFRGVEHSFFELVEDEIKVELVLDFYT